MSKGCKPDPCIAVAIGLILAFIAVIVHNTSSDTSSVASAAGISACSQPLFGANYVTFVECGTGDYITVYSGGMVVREYR
jgi:hypothetical protein